MKAFELSKRLTSNRWFKMFFIMFTIVILTFNLVLSFSNEKFSLPNNPLNNVLADNSFIPLQGNYASLLEEKEEKEEKEEVQEKEQQEEKGNPNVDEERPNDQKHDNKQDFKEKEKETEEAQGTSDSSHKNEVNQGKDGSSTGGSSEKGIGNSGEIVTELDEDSPHTELIDDSDDDSPSQIEEYFSTTIVDGETVTEPVYPFKIIQKDHDYLVEKIEVHVNERPVEDFKGEVSLEENENKITILVTYKDPVTNELFTVARTYTVYLNSIEIILYTDLEKEQKVDEEKLEFFAQALYRGEEVPLKVTLNDKVVKEKEDGKYIVILQEGKNTLRLEASKKNKKVAEEYVVIYEKPVESIRFDTDLTNETVTESEYRFYAKANIGKKTIPVTVTVNQDVVNGDESGNYTVQLREGKNIIKLEAKEGKVSAEKSFTIHFSKPDGGNKEEVESKFYILFPDLKDGQTIRNSRHTFHINVVDDKGKLYTHHGIRIMATNNGEQIPVDWVNDAKVSFKLSVVNGANDIKVTARDRDGNTAEASITIYGDIANEDEVIGTITFSIEATTIGLGYIIPPISVDIYPKERASQLLDRVLREHGFSYEFTGTLEKNFYLSAIYKPGLVKNPKIPEDLAELVSRDLSRFDPEDYHPDYLGEFDFSNGSGWMYSVNGHYPNVGFADYYLKDEDVLRIRYTLAYGADIGGGMPGTNYDKEW